MSTPRTANALLAMWLGVYQNTNIESGICRCGDSMDRHSNPMDCGHSPVDQGAYIAAGLAKDTEDFLNPPKSTDDDL